MNQLVICVRLTHNLLIFDIDILQFAHRLWAFTHLTLRSYVLMNPVGSVCFTHNLLTFAIAILQFAHGLWPFTYLTLRSDVLMNPVVSMCFTHIAIDILQLLRPVCHNLKVDGSPKVSRAKPLCRPASKQAMLLYQPKKAKNP